LHQYQPKEFDEVVRRVHEEKMESWQAELDVMGATHSDVGGWLCARWNFPPALCAGVQFHHQPWEAGKFTSLAALVNLADRLLLDASPRGAEIAPLEKDAQLCAILSSEGVPIQVADLQDLARSLHQELEKSQELREVFA
jgi:HD-like signal output (HDOD) protein